MNENGFVYILRSIKNGSFYVGSTNNLERRLRQHISGMSKYTKDILPIELVFEQKFDKIQLAHKVERWLKKQKDRDFLIRIINEGKITKRF